MSANRPNRATHNEFWILWEIQMMWYEPDPQQRVREYTDNLAFEVERRAYNDFFEDGRTPEMQTFLPYPDFEWSAKVLDRMRLGKQRVEAWQILNALKGTYTHSHAWANHPVVLQWDGHYSYLQRYFNAMQKEWITRGYSTDLPNWIRPFDTLAIPNIELDVRSSDAGTIILRHLDRLGYPVWLGLPELHASHRAALLAKAPDWYEQFRWTEPRVIDYFWPVRSFDTVTNTYWTYSRESGINYCTDTYYSIFHPSGTI